MSKLFRLALAILIATPLTASAQNAPATEAITLTGPGKFAGVFEVKTQATIAAVDPAARSVVLARKNGTQLTLVVGDTVKKGQVVCIIEAMKLLNEVEADMDGTVKEVCVENGQPVEFGQSLFIIE